MRVRMEHLGVARGGRAAACFRVTLQKATACAAGWEVRGSAALEAWRLLQQAGGGEAAGLSPSGL